MMINGPKRAAQHHQMWPGDKTRNVLSLFLNMHCNAHSVLLSNYFFDRVKFESCISGLLQLHAVLSSPNVCELKMYQHMLVAVKISPSDYFLFT